MRLFREGFTFGSTGPGQGQGNRARDIGGMAGRGPPERTVDASPSYALIPKRCVEKVAGSDHRSYRVSTASSTQPKARHS